MSRALAPRESRARASFIPRRPRALQHARPSPHSSKACHCDQTTVNSYYGLTYTRSGSPTRQPPILFYPSGQPDTILRSDRSFRQPRKLRSPPGHSSFGRGFAEFHRHRHLPTGDIE
jgi:hypothetical protein